MAIHRSQAADVTWASANGQCNICVFNAAAARAVDAMFRGISTISKEAAIAGEWSAGPYNVKCLQGLREARHPEHAAHAGRRVVYDPSDGGVGITRDVLHFGSLDLEKYFIAVGPNTAYTYEAHPSKP